MLKWIVYVEDCNRKEICDYDIFKHARFMDDCRKNARRNKNDKDAFMERLLGDIKYYFWSKCEYEIVLTSWPSFRQTFHERKIDVSDQILLNWEVFADYVWEHRTELARRPKPAKPVEGGSENA